MTKLEYLNIIRSASINVIARNCNLLELGVAPSNTTLIQLQFLSIIEACYRNIELFNDIQLNILNNNINLILNDMPNTIYNTVGLPIDSGDVIVAVPIEYKSVYDEILILFSSYGGDRLEESLDYNLETSNVAIQLFNIINSAIAAKTSGLTELAAKLYDYVVEKLSIIK